jgi:hypothetical protein
MNVTEMQVRDIKPYDNNPRKNDKAVQAVANSIKEFGFKVPIIVDRDNVVVAGHTRLKAAELLGLERVPVVIADDLTEEQVRAFRIADNKTAGLADWDEEKLAEELKALDDLFAMTDFGFGDFELSMLTSDYEPEPYDKEDIEPYKKNEGDYLAKMRVIITYTEENEEAVRRMLGVDEIEKVVYDITEIMR